MALAILEMWILLRAERPSALMACFNIPQRSSAYTETAHADVGVLKPFIKEFDFFPFFLEGDAVQQRQVMIVGGYGGFGILQSFVFNQLIMITLSEKLGHGSVE